MKICIILNGEIKDYKYIKSIICKNNYDYIICSDGGANHTYKMNIVPDYIIGDLDSIEDNVIKYYKSKNVKFNKFPTKKDETDTELSIWLANRLNAKKIDLIGALGGRIDHTIANINLMYYIKNLDINPIIQTSEEDIFLVSNETSVIRGDKGDTLSIIPIKDDANGVTLKDLEYPLDNYKINYGSPIGMSNIMKKDECEIAVKEGNLIVIRNKKSV